MRKRYKNHTFFFGFIKKFQGLGFMISTDNPVAVDKYFLIEIRLLWLKTWYTYKFKTFR